MRLPECESESDIPNLIPMIDVVFLLLIFFLVATRFDQEERELDMQLAEVAKARPLTMPPGELIVNVNEKGEFIIVGRTVDINELATLLHQRATNNPGAAQSVQIRVDERAPFGYPARVAGLCKHERIRYYCTVQQQH